MSGLILDEHCSRAGMVVEPFDCTLNMTDLKDNKNKFYIMQIIQHMQVPSQLMLNQISPALAL